MSSYFHGGREDGSVRRFHVGSWHDFGQLHEELQWAKEGRYVEDREHHCAEETRGNREYTAP